MKVAVVVLAAVVCLAAGEAPYPAPNGPQGGLLVAKQRPLPAQQYGPPAQQYGPPAQQYGPPAEASAKTQSELERLKTKEGSESGVYHVLLPDGRLQKVEYATAPLKEEEKKPEPEVEAVPVWPVRYFDIQTYQGSQYREAAPQPDFGFASRRQEVTAQAPVVMVMPRPAAYVASIQYRDVEPIDPPVYTYKDANSPLVRIIRK